MRAIAPAKIDRRLSVLLLTLCLLLASVAAAESLSYQRFSIRVVWGGGTNCSIPFNIACNDSGLTLWPQGWAASQPGHGGGNWNKGLRNFANPLPANMRIAWVEIDLYGRFECSPDETHNSFSVLVQKEVIASMDFRPNATSCSGCLNCGYLQQITSKNYGKTGLPGYDYGPRAPNPLSLVLKSGMLVLNGADIHLYAMESGGAESSIDMAKWEFIGILLSALVGVVILVSSACFGILLFLKSRERKQRDAYKQIGDGRKPSATQGGRDTYDYEYEDTTDYEKTHDVIINVGGEEISRLSGSAAATENSSLLTSPDTPTGNLGNPAKAKEARGDRLSGDEGHQQQHQRNQQLKRSVKRPGSRTRNWRKQIQVTEIKILGRIGRGSYGDVYKGVWQGTVVAVKKLPGYFLELREDESAAFLDNFQREAAIMKSLHHPNILQLLSTYMEPPDLCLVMEYMPKGSLYRILHDPSVQLDWPIIRKILLDAAKGMAYLHGCQPVVIHRDLKSHNLLIDQNWTCKVCDFGLSKFMTDRPASMTSCGTPSWTAPEVLRNERYTEKADIFGFGVVLWECITREDPHAGMPPFQVVLEVGSKHLRPDIPKSAPKALQDLIKSCWEEKPALRPSFQDIVQILLSMKVQMLYSVHAENEEVVREGKGEGGEGGEGEDEEPVGPVMLQSPSTDLLGYGMPASGVPPPQD